MGPGAVLGKRAAKRAARALAAQVEAKEKASLAQASLPPLKLPPWNKKIRISSQPLHWYAFFTPSSPLICSWIQPARRDRMFGPGVTRCERILGYSFKSKVLLAEALTVELNSTPAGQFKLGTSHFYLPPNKRLALYGDSILRTYLARKWLELGPSGTGQLCVTSSDVLSDQNFGRIYLKLGLNLCVTSEPPNDGKLNPEKDKLPKHMATTMEAIVAAAFVDGGDEALEIVLKRMGMDQHFREEPATQYDFFRHGRPPSEDSPLPSAPSPVPKPAES
ncbi:ribonuclease III domain-containing protein [Apiospora saccharicola]